MPTSVYLLIAVILFGGIGGATANFLLMPPPDNEARNWQTLIRLIIGGIFVSFTVPLFLSLAQSTLIQRILTSSDSSGGIPELFILAGFCTAVSFSARNFMTGLSARILADIAKTKEDAEKTKEIAKQTREKIENVDEAIGEALDQASGDVVEKLETKSDPPLRHESSIMQLTPEELKVLQMAGRLTMRTATGIAKDSGIPRHQVGELLDSLISKSLIEKTTSPNTGGVRHRLTTLGLAALNSQLQRRDSDRPEGN